MGREAEERGIEAGAGMSDLIAQLKSALAKPHDFALIKHWPAKQNAIGSGNKLHAYTLGVRDENLRTAPIVAELIALIPDIEHAMAFYKSCGDQAEPEFQCHAMFAAALARLAAAIEGRG